MRKLRPFRPSSMMELEGRVVPGFLATQRWAAPAGVAFAEGPAARGAGAAGAALADWCLPQPDLERWLVAIFEVRSGAQAGEYFVPLTIALEDADEARYRRLLPAALARVRQHAATGVLADAAADEDFCRMVIDAIGAGRELETRAGRLRCAPTSAFAELRAGAHPGELALVPAGPQGANTTVRIGNAFFLKLFRRLHAGGEPAVDLARYLTEVTHFPNTPPLAGMIEYQRGDAAPATLAMLEGFVSNQGDGWDYTVNHLVRFLEERVTQPARPADSHGLYLALVRTLATRIAQLHGVLASATGPSLVPEPLTAADLEAWRRVAHAALTAALKMLAERAAQLAPDAAASANTLLARRAALLRSVAVRRGAAPQGLKIRCHGDFHLRQVLLRRNDFVITDVGAAGQSVAAQRRRCSPLADVARMLRSFAYARRMALQQCSLIAPDDRQRWQPQLDAWEEQTRSAFLEAYDEVARGNGLYASLTEVLPLLRLFELEGACADLQKALLGRPEWVGVPLRILVTLAG